MAIESSRCTCMSRAGVGTAREPKRITPVTIQCMDSNDTVGGRVDFDDFMEQMTPMLLAETAGMIGLKELKEAFIEFDLDGDGSITSDELKRAMLKLLGEQTSKKEIEAVVKEADDNGDGTVDFEEFVRMMSQK
ncbi:calcium-binding protein 5-like isoform X1 [Festucalex cinctus]